MLCPEVLGTRHSASFFTTLHLSKYQYGKILKMERRRSNRKIIRLDAEIISGNTSCAGFIDNLSVNGMYMRTLPGQISIDIIPGTIFDIRLKHAPGGTLNLNCRVLWSYKNPPHGLTYSIGMEIINPPQEYKAFIETL